MLLSETVRHLAASEFAVGHRPEVRTTVRDTPIRTLTFAHEGLAQAGTLRNGPARSPTDRTQQLYYERRGLLELLAETHAMDAGETRKLELRAAICCMA